MWRSHMTDENNDAEACELGGGVIRRVDHAPQMRGMGSTYVPIFVGEMLPLPKVKELSLAEVKTVDAGEGLYPDAKLGFGGLDVHSGYRILKLLSVISVICGLMWAFFPWKIFEPRPDGSQETQVSIATPTKDDIRSYQRQPDGMLPHRKAWIGLYLLVQSNQYNTACSSGKEYWNDISRHCNKDWLPVWEQYLLALNLTQQAEACFLISKKLHEQFPDNIPVSLYYAQSQLADFEKRYARIQGAEDKRKNRGEAGSLNILLDEVIRQSEVADKMLNPPGGAKTSDPNQILPAALKGKARFYKWKLEGDGRWGNTEPLVAAVEYARKGRSSDAEALKREMAVYCFDTWGFRGWPIPIPRTIGGARYGRENFKKYIEQ
jgi:hypothetical protein